MVKVFLDGIGVLRSFFSILKIIVSNAFDAFPLLFGPPAQNPTGVIPQASSASLASTSVLSKKKGSVRF